MASEGYVYDLVRGLITNRDQQSNRKYLTQLLVRILYGRCVWEAMKSVFMEIFLKEQQYLTLRTSQKLPKHSLR